MIAADATTHSRPGDTGLPVASGRETAGEVWRRCRGHRARLVAVVLLGIASTAISLIPPILIGVLVDDVQQGDADRRTVLVITAIMAVAALVGSSGTAATTTLATRVYQTILARLREHLVGRGLELRQHVVERAGTGDLISRTSDDVTAIADAAPAVIGALTVTAFTVVVSFGGLLVLEWPYAAAFVVVLPVYALAMRWYLRTGPAIYRAERTAMSARAQEIVESQRGYTTVAGFGLGEQRHDTVMNASWGVAVHTLRARTVQSMFNGRLNFAECLSLATVLIVGFVLIDQGSSSVGAATTAMLVVLRLLDPINQLLFTVDTIQSAAASLTRIIGVVTISDSTAADPQVAPDSTARLGDVSFHYEGGPPALDHVTLDVAAGEHVAVVGASGAGKTTLAAVIAGIHLPTSGTVNRPDRTALISQEVHVFTGSIRDNLTLGAPKASDSEIRAALGSAGAAALLDLHPDGLDAIVGAGGHQLTDGQAQQLALTRLMLLDPDLAILDEATAEAGSTDAKLLDRTAEAAMRGRTGLVIAHRLSQAASCDRIVVMEHGRIIEAGTHDELVTAGGVYAGLWSAWEAGREAPPGV